MTSYVHVLFAKLDWQNWSGAKMRIHIAIRYGFLRFWDSQQSALDAFSFLLRFCVEQNKHRNRGANNNLAKKIKLSPFLSEEFDVQIYWLQTRILLSFSELFIQHCITRSSVWCVCGCKLKETSTVSVIS